MISILLVCLVGATGSSQGAAVRVVPQPTNAIAINKSTGHLWATVPPDSTSYPGSIVEMDPVTGKILNTIDAGKNNIGDSTKPFALAFSDDGSALYVGLDDVPSIRRINPLTRATVMETPLLHHMKAWDIQVRPGHADTVSVTKWLYTRTTGCSGPMLIVNGKSLPKELPDYFGSAQVFVGADTLFCCDNNVQPESLHRCQVGEDGVTVVGDPLRASGRIISNLVMEGNKIYTAGGWIVDATTCAVLGQFPLVGSAGCAIDGANNRAFFLIQEPPNYNTLTLYAYDLKTRALVERRELGSITLDIRSSESLPELNRWGSTGLVFRTGKSLYFIDHAPGL